MTCLSLHSLGMGVPCLGEWQGPVDDFSISRHVDDKWAEGNNWSDDSMGGTGRNVSTND